MYRNAVLLCGAMIMAFGVLPIAPTSAQGGPQPPPTNVLYGFINNSRTLTYAYPGPDYFLPGDLVVLSNATLTIEPGVTLHFKANGDTLGGGDYPSLVELYVQGTLIADATSGDSIRFVSIGGGSGQWGQIKVDGPATMRRVSIQGPKVGISSSNILTLERSSISASDLCVSMTYPGSAVRFCQMSDGNNGIYAGNGSILECSLRGKGLNGGYGIFLNSPASIAVADSTDPRPTVISNYTYGIQTFAHSDIEHVVVHHNEVGIYSSSGPTTVTYCTASNNNSYGIYLPSQGGRIFTSIATQNGTGISIGGICANFGAAYLDSWTNGSNFNFIGCPNGPNLAAFNPFFLSPGVDYRLASGSIFKTYGPWGAEIGAYGPGPGSPTATRQSSWGAIKATYR